MFIPYVKKQFERTTRVDIVWDTYAPDMKESTHEKRGKGIRRKASGQTKLPRSGWISFMTQITKRNYLHSSHPKLPSLPFTRQGCIHNIRQISCVVGSGNPNMLECNHEEADTRVVVHIVHVFATGHEDN